MNVAFNRVVASITLRAVFGRKRALLFAIPPLILILITLVLKEARPPGAADGGPGVLGERADGVHHIGRLGGLNDFVGAHLAGSFDLPIPFHD